MVKQKENKLELSRVLAALDNQDLDFYNKLDADEKKAYVPVVLMRYMSSLSDQNQNSAYAILATNDLVNVGFWSLYKHPELQHMLLCVAGLGSKQYHTWISAKKLKNSNKLHQYVCEIYPQFNHSEIELFLSKFTSSTWKEFLINSGADDDSLKELLSLWKKIYNE